MTDSVLKSVMRLFAIVGNLKTTDIVADAEENYKHSLNVTDAYLNQLLNPSQVQRNLQIFEFHFKNLQKKKTISANKRISLFSVKTLLICEQINEVVEAKQKIYIIIQLLDILSINKDLSFEAFEFVKTIAESIGITNSEYNILYMFVFQSIARKRKHESFLLVNNLEDDAKSVHQIYREHLDGQIVFYHHTETNIFYFRHEIENDELMLNGRSVIFNRFYMFDKGSVIRCPKIAPIYFSDITTKFLKANIALKIHLVAKDIEYSFKNSDNGFKKSSFSAESGQMVGIMGGSGVGKSTLLSILNGTLPPHSGTVCINGFDLYSESKLLKGIIGFIPQDDFLIEELSVFDNLYFNARLCFSHLSQEKIVEKVDQLLTELDLYETRDLQVGSTLNKLISGGQRKRLNIALELLREPQVLFVDEPTSGLSSNDSEKIIEILKKLTYNGKLVIINIHQPSSDIFKMFDKLLLLDKGGRIIYYGNPIESVVYFKTASQLVNASESECIWCGNLNPEQVLQIIEAQKVNFRGFPTKERKVSPEEWFQLLQNKTTKKPTIDITKTQLPESNFRKPSGAKQFIIYLCRNIKTKISDKQYLLINLLEAPLLAFIVAFFSKYISGTSDNPNEYLLINNINIPAYLFMSIVVALFLGMMVGAEEIIKDRKLLKRESFLNLSRLSFINSKVVYVFLISAFQMFVFVLITNYVLEIKGLNWEYWTILFSTSCFANMLSLNISDGMKTVVAIYILIPLMLIPQFLLSGVIIKFDKLHPMLRSEEQVPFVGDIMASRWAYEALAVSQFCYNKFESDLYELEQKESEITFCSNYWIPEIVNSLNYCELNLENDSINQSLKNEITLLKNELESIAVFLNIPEYENIDKINLDSLNKDQIKQTRDYLRKVRLRTSGMLEIAIDNKNEKIKAIGEKIGRANLVKMKEQNYNNALADELLNRKETDRLIYKYKNKLSNNYEPIFNMPDKKNGRAHFYAPFKKVGKIKLSTFAFNIIIIWLMSFGLYLLLVYNILGKLMTKIHTISLSRDLRKIEKK